MTARLRPIAVVVFAALVVACIATFGISVEALVDSLALCGARCGHGHRFRAAHRAEQDHRAGPRGRARRPDGPRSVGRVDRRRARRGRLLPHRGADLPGRARHGRRQARRVPRRLARRAGDRRALRRLAPGRDSGRSSSSRPRGERRGRWASRSRRSSPAAPWSRCSGATRSWTRGLGKAVAVVALALALLATGCGGGGGEETTVAVPCNDAAFRAQDEELYVTKTAVSNAIGGGGAPGGAAARPPAGAEERSAATSPRHPPCAEDLRSGSPPRSRRRSTSSTRRLRRSRPRRMRRRISPRRCASLRSAQSALIAGQ